MILRWQTIVAAALGTALTLAAYEAYKRWQIRHYKAAAYVAQGLHLGSQLKNHVALFRSDTGKMPRSNADVGLPPGEELASEAVVAADIGPGGVITVRFNDLSGVNGGLVTLRPIDQGPPRGLSWQCRTPSYRDIQEWAPQCRYETGG